ncbi:MAG: tetratricopeptide repeat protein [Gemmatimonadaceae bacterium]|nr:tetratricopeptide repeat protein [Gemmatimonadaceae bacterium]MCW5827618.1 tetratricopeptide repeat protein [Gemmatimonadaceae bacterium]
MISLRVRSSLLRGGLALLLVASVFRPLSAQQVSQDSLRSAVERAVIAADWVAIDRAAVALRAATQTASGRNDAWLHYDLAYALHRRASGLIIEGRASDAKAMLEEAIAAAARSRALGGGAQAQALEGAVTGQLAGAAGGLAMMRNGRASFRLLDEAVAAAPNDPRVALLNGISRTNAPAFAGGGAARGETELRRAVALFANDRAVSPQPVWGRADAHIWLAIALEKQNKLAEAREQLELALVHAPGHRWVVETLRPALAARR